MHSAENSGTGSGLSGHSDTGHGVVTRGYGTGLAGSAVYAGGPLAASIALWLRNTNEFSDDATLLVSNNGTGYRLKGLGGDGGEHEFRVDNQGRLWAKGDLAQSRAADGLAKANLYARCHFYGSPAKHSCQVERSFNNVEGTVYAVPGRQVGCFIVNWGLDVSDRYWVAMGAGLSSPMRLGKEAVTCWLGSSTSQLGRPDPLPLTCGQPSPRF